MTPCPIIHGDCLEIMRGMAANSVDLVFGSPPYEAARTYGIDFALKGQDWVDWMVERMVEMVRVSKGLVAMVVEGQTRQYQWSATPALLMADLHRAGFKLRKPPVFKRSGIPGSGGPDWLRNDYEFVICCTKGKLPWSCNTAMGKPPKFAPGGAPSHRRANGTRVNGEHVIMTRERPGTHSQKSTIYTPPAIANPGNVIDCGAAGGGNIGDKLAHENEAPFPEYLAEFFVRSFCPEGGTVLDPFSGSGTTAAVAERCGREWVAIDVRESQVNLTRKRVANASKPLLAGA